MTGSVSEFLQYITVLKNKEKIQRLSFAVNYGCETRNQFVHYKKEKISKKIIVT